MEIIAEEGRGAVLLFRDPHPTLRLDEDDDDAPRTIKRTGTGAQIMAALGFQDLILLTDSPETKYKGLEAYNLRIVGTRPITKD